MVKIEYYRIFMKFPVIPGRKSNSREFPGIPEREFPVALVKMRRGKEGVRFHSQQSFCVRWLASFRFEHHIQ
jgi:hypothetical protein